jgi:hypothetical protein
VKMKIEKIGYKKKRRRRRFEKQIGKCIRI